jgi:hypothetical protein
MAAYLLLQNTADVCVGGVGGQRQRRLRPWVRQRHRCRQGRLGGRKRRLMLLVLRKQFWQILTLQKIG